MNDMPAQSHEHPAPPAYRPLSGGAITALILAIVLGIAASLGPWWLPVIALAVAALSWPAISAGRRRGAGLAIAASVMALAAGTYAYINVGRLVEEMQSEFGSLMTALAKDDRKAMTPWVMKGEDPVPVLASWHERYVAASAEVGEYSGTTVVRTGLLGPWAGIVVRPGDLTEIGTAAGAPTPSPDVGPAMWFESVFARARVHVALVLGVRDGPKDDLTEALKAGGDGKGFPVVHEIRFFR